jgi:hypothetical protein
VQHFSCLSFECLDHHLYVHHHVRSMLCVDMVAGLGGHGVDKCLEHVHCHRRLGAIECRLRRVKLGEQTVGNTRFVDEALRGCVLDAATQGLNGGFVGAGIYRLCT